MSEPISYQEKIEWRRIRFSLGMNSPPQKQSDKATASDGDSRDAGGLKNPAVASALVRFAARFREKLEAKNASARGTEAKRK